MPQRAYYGNKPPLFVVHPVMELDILGRSVTVVVHDYGDEGSTQGEWLPNTSEIRIRKGLNAQDSARVLLHEVAHVVWQATGAQNRKIGEEDFATICELFLEIFKKF